MAESQQPGKNPRDRDSEKTLDGKIVQWRSPRAYRASKRIAVFNLLAILLTFISLFQAAKEPQTVLFFSMVSLVLYLIQALIPRTVDGEDRWKKWNPKSMVFTVGAPALCSAYAVLITVLH